MEHSIYCVKLKKQAEGLETAPYPGPLGERIFNNVSQEAWDLWLKRQTMLINEYRLNMQDAEARRFLKEEMQKFLFEDGDQVPPGYKPIN